MKQVFDIRPGKGFTKAQSDEHRRRWSERAWKHAMDNGNYDRTRAHLNFEIARGGIVQPIDTSRSIPQRIHDTVKARGIRDRNEGLKEPKYRTVANIVFSGSRERMRELGFGNQTIDYEKDADNSKVTRMPQIEAWAKDIYRWACDKWGEDNIIQFICHMDETTPHIHCTLLPVDHRNQLSFRNVFAGPDIAEYRRRLAALYDSLAVVNARWGLTRGDGSTGRHVSPQEYTRRLSAENEQLAKRHEKLSAENTSLEEQLRQAQKRVKALTTMTANIETRHAELLEKLESLKSVHRNAKDRENQTSSQMEQLCAELAEVDAQLADRRLKLDMAQRALDLMALKIDSARDHLNALQTNRQNAEMELLAIAKRNVAIAGMEMMAKEFKQVAGLMHPDTMSQFDGSLLKDLAENGTNILVCAWMLFGGYINEATEFAQSQGGGGSEPELPWHRKEDEDDSRWAYRCLHQARKMLQPQSATPSAAEWYFEYDFIKCLFDFHGNATASNFKQITANVFIILGIHQYS